MYRVSFYKAFSGWVVFLFIFLLSAYAFAGNDSLPIKDRACVKILPEITEGLQDPKLVKALEVLIGQAQALESAQDTLPYSDLSEDAKLALQYVRRWFHQNRNGSLDAFLTEATKGAIQTLGENRGKLKQEIQRLEAEVVELSKGVARRKAEAESWRSISLAVGTVRAEGDRAVLARLSDGLKQNVAFSEVADWIKSANTSLDEIAKRASENQLRLEQEWVEIESQIAAAEKQKEKQKEALKSVNDRLKSLANKAPEEAFVQFLRQLSIRAYSVSLKDLRDGLDSAFEDLNAADQAVINEIRSYVMTGKMDEVKKLLLEARVRKALSKHFSSGILEVWWSNYSRQLVLDFYPRWLVGDDYASGPLVDSFSAVIRGLDYEYFESFLSIESGLNAQELSTLAHLRAKAEVVSKEDTRRMRMRLDRQEIELLKKFYRAGVSDRPYLYTGIFGARGKSSVQRSLALFLLAPWTKKHDVSSVAVSNLARDVDRRAERGIRNSASKLSRLLRRVTVASVTMILVGVPVADTAYWGIRHNRYPFEVTWAERQPVYQDVAAWIDTNRDQAWQATQPARAWTANQWSTQVSPRIDPAVESVQNWIVEQIEEIRGN